MIGRGPASLGAIIALQLLAATLTPDSAAAQGERGQGSATRPLAILALRAAAEADYAAGRYQAALAKLTDAHRSASAALGPDDPLTIAIAVDQAAAFGGVGDLVTEEAMERRLSAVQMLALGDAHPDTQNVLLNHGVTLYRLHRPAEAEPLVRRVWVLRQRRLGEADPATLEAAFGLGLICDELLRSQEAETLLRRVYLLRQERLGAGAAATLVAANALINPLRSLGRGDEADRLLLEIAPLALANLDGGDPAAIQSALDIAHSVAIALGKLDSAQDALDVLQVAILVQQQRAPNDRSRLNGLRYTQAVLLAQAGRQVDAEVMMVSAADAIRAENAAGAPPTRLQAAAYAGLGRIRGNLKRWPQAYAAYAQASDSLRGAYRDRGASGADEVADRLLVQNRDIFIDQISSGWQWAHQP